MRYPASGMDGARRLGRRADCTHHRVESASLYLDNALRLITRACCCLAMKAIFPKKSYPADKSSSKRYADANAFALPALGFLWRVHTCETSG